MQFLVTGSAGFIGYHVSMRLCNEGHDVIGLDNLNNYYDINLKESRVRNLNIQKSFKFLKGDLEDATVIDSIFEENKINRVIHLAAQAGVRYSIENPSAYINSNIVGFLSIIEACRHHKVDHLVYASSSSVYGLNKKMPFSTLDGTDHPVALYGATKKANELMAHSYSHLYGIPTTGLRFFTVYGPYGRPDMALFKFVKAIKEGQPIQIFNRGNMTRDFTYIDDIVEAIYRLQNIPPSSQLDTLKLTPNTSSAPYKVFNIGNGNPVNLMDFINEIESYLNINAIKDFLPMQDGDVQNTEADTSDLYQMIDFKPRTNIKDGLKNFLDWHEDYYS